MPRRTNTRECFVKTTAELLRQRGYYATGINQILAASGAPKGSLYFHFPGGKEQLVAEAVTVAGQQMSVAINAILADADDVRTGCARLMAAFEQILVGSDFREGCPVATIALDVAADSEPIGSACSDAYGGWLEVIEKTLRRWGVPGDQVGRLAVFVLSSTEGALLLARVRRDTAVLDEVGQYLTDTIESAIH
ncbi:TetR/AcrR family transcriptional regulator [Nocardia sp. NEAU-G5]|uniref:TetR/AcrR family transcriptional regulator n=1 Tax=Nocardia albiluteola TaxID=2842303 RepID=A0ABS6AU18_9NOCA|nr:TetR/AcrR family transcriptional regulator [Nocardia albiluteola]MBU3060445.1 TetR/AcrR family transcriptional regulator [Nocardia albiluteola]